MPSTTRNTGFLNYIYEFCILSNKDYEIILAYEGVINNQTIKAFTSLTEVNMSKNNETEFLQKKVYHVMVEFLQNIIKHASPHGIGECQEYADCHGILVVCHDQNEYHITTGNLIQKSLIPGLSDRISQTNSLSKEELDKHYLSQLKNGHISDE